MKIKIISDCIAYNQSFKIGDEVEVAENIGKDLCNHNFAKELLKKESKNHDE